MVAYESALKKYLSEMREFCTPNGPSASPEELSKHHVSCRENAIDAFNAERKMGVEMYSQKFLEDLEVAIQKAYDKEFTVLNEEKRKASSSYWRGVIIGGIGTAATGAAVVAAGVAAIAVTSTEAVAGVTAGLYALGRSFR